MLDLFFDPGFLSALSAAVGPLAFFVAPTEEIEALIFEKHASEDVLADAEIGVGAAQPSILVPYREAA